MDRDVYIYEYLYTNQVIRYYPIVLPSNIHKKKKKKIYKITPNI